MTSGSSVVMTALEQFVYGMGGGGLVAFSNLLAYARAVPPDDPAPGRYKILITVAAWVAYVLSAGFAAHLCEPHHMLLAAYEGAALPALFFTMRHHYQAEKDYRARRGR